MIAKIVAAQGGGDFVRLGRYITDVKAEGKSTAAERLGAYVIDAAHGGEKVAWSRVTNCGTDEPRVALIEIKHTQAMNTRAANKTLHLVVSFPEGERPTDAQLHAIEDSLCAALGMADHQRLSALHINTAHVHLHVAVNRIHPDTLKCIDPSFGQRKLMVACRDLEIAHGLSRNNHGLGPEEYSHNPVRGRAADMEAQTGRESFTRWVQDTVREDLLAAKAQGWTALHRAAASHGLLLKPRGAGLVITDSEGTKAVKASSVDRLLSLPALVAACGPYQAAEPCQDLPSAKGRYEARPLQRHGAAKDLYAAYQKQHTEALAARTREMADLRENQRAYRQQLGQWYREEKKKLREGWLESLAPDKGARFRQLSQQRETLWERSKTAEKDGHAKIRAAHPLPGWIDWLQAHAQRGDLAALEVLRSREAKSQHLTSSLLRAENAGEAAAIVLTHRRPVVGRDGRVAYRLDDGGLVQDQDSRVAVTRESRAAAALAVTLAANRFGARPLTVEGSAQFRQWVAEEANRPGMRVRFTNLPQNPVREPEKKEEHAPARPMPATTGKPAERPDSPTGAPLPYRPWSPDLKGEFTYMGLRDRTAGPALVWQQGEALYAQPATPKAQQAAADVEPGDRVIFFQGRPVISRRSETDRDTGRDTGWGR